MKRKIKWHRLKKEAKTLFLATLIAISLMFCVCSLVHLLLIEFKAMISFVISLTMLVLFGVANKGVFM
jgi:hypothetical protein